MKYALLILFASYYLSLSGQVYKRCSDYVPVPDSFSVSGNIYFVDTTGNDANPGTASLPWRTIQKAASQMAPADLTYVRQGIYHETNISFARSGTAANPIILSAYKSGNIYDSVIIDGSLDTNWATGVLIDSSHYIIQGIIIQNMHNHGIKATETPQQHSNIMLKDITSRYNGNALPAGVGGHGVILHNLDNFKLENVTAHNNHGNGIAMIGSDTSLFSQNGWIVDCFSYDNNDSTAIFVSNAHGFAIDQGRNIAICSCTASGNTDHGFDVSDWPKGDLLSQYITLEDNVSVGNLYAAGFAVNSDSHHILFLRNLSVRNYYGFYGYAGVGRLELFHNVSMYNRNQGMLVDTVYAVYANPGDSTIILKNNIFYKNDTIGFGYLELQIDTNNLEYDVQPSNNLFFPFPPDTILAQIGSNSYHTGNLWSLGAGHLSVSPKFTDTTSFLPDVNPDTTSPVIDAGTVIYINGLPEPYFGNAPDMGIYEYQPPVGVNFSNQISLPDFKIYPNPATENITIEIADSKNENFTLTIYSLTGQLIKTIETNKNIVTIDNNNITSGLYFYQIHRANDKRLIGQGKLIIQ